MFHVWVKVSDEDRGLPAFMINERISRENKLPKWVLMSKANNYGMEGK